VTPVERYVDANGLRMHVLEQGSGPVVLLLHGFPDLPCVWHAQMAALAGAGFRALAPTQRGYGRTEGASGPGHSTMLHLVGDAVALLDALGVGDAVVVGHDWGANVAWHCAMMRPDRFRAVVGLSTPFAPRGDTCPTERIRGFVGDAYFYVLHFQKPGLAEADFAAMDLREAFRRVLYGASGHALPGARWRPAGPRDMRFFEGTQDPRGLPPWLEAERIERYAAEFSRTGFTGALNWYRAMDLSWALTAPFAGASVQVPALFLFGEEDPVVRHVHRSIVHLRRHVPRLIDSIAMPGVGHWPQLERSDHVSAALIHFLRTLA
jgi:pimeloyl-ACP methyl ester carboxylesterase